MKASPICSILSAFAGERNLQEVIYRIRNVKDAENALKAAEVFRIRRAGLEQHTPLKSSTSKLILQVALSPDTSDRMELLLSVSTAALVSEDA